MEHLLYSRDDLLNLVDKYIHLSYWRHEDDDLIYFKFSSIFDILIDKKRMGGWITDSKGNKLSRNDLNRIMDMKVFW